MMRVAPESRVALIASCERVPLRQSSMGNFDTHVHGPISKMGVAVTRIDGADRYATSAAVAREVRSFASPKSLTVATGASFAGTLSLGPWCYATASSVLCVPKGGKLSGEALAEATSDSYASPP